CARKSTSLH
nr:immunoglobulin heavy chain junction region [Homo sapiens]MBN4559601.1 immunoglobulin heavy chain junction region [Homo sapiens]